MAVNDQDVGAFAQRLKKLHEEVRAEELASAGNRFSSRETVGEINIGTSNRIFYDRVVPHVRDRFWTYAGRNIPPSGRNIPVDGAPLTDNEILCINGIFSAIKKMILDSIKNDEQEDPVTRKWVAENTEFLINPSHPRHAQAMLESRTKPVTLTKPIEITETRVTRLDGKERREKIILATITQQNGYLGSRISTLQTAWRNFDPDAPRSMAVNTNPPWAWRKVFTGPQAIPELQRRLAYTFVLIKDPAQPPDIQRLMEGSFIGGLAAIPRSHIYANDPRGNYFELDDDCACTAGTFQHLTYIGAQHPIAALPMGPAELIFREMGSIIQGPLTQAFHLKFLHPRTPRDLESKLRLRDALSTLHRENANQVIRNNEQYTTELLAEREGFIRSLPPEDTIFAQITNALRTAGIRGPFGMEYVLSPAEQNRIRLMMMDPCSYYSDNITEVFTKSLTADERDELAELEANTIIQFNKLKEKALSKARSSQTGGLGYYSEPAIRRRVIQELAGKGCEDGDIGRIEAALTAHEDNALVEKYNETVNLTKKELLDGGMPKPEAEFLHQRAIAKIVRKGKPGIEGRDFKLAAERLEQRLQVALDNILLKKFELKLNLISAVDGNESARLAKIIRFMARERGQVEGKAFEEEQIALRRQIVAAMQRRRRHLPINREIVEDLLGFANNPILSHELHPIAPITPENLEDLIDSFTDTIDHLGMMENAVYFPNHPGQVGTQKIFFFDRGPLETYFTAQGAPEVECPLTRARLKREHMRPAEQFRRVTLIAASQAVEAHSIPGSDLTGKLKQAVEPKVMEESKREAEMQKALTCIRTREGYTFSKEVEENKKLMERLWNWGIGVRPDSFGLFMRVALIAAEEATKAHPIPPADRKAREEVMARFRLALARLDPNTDLEVQYVLNRLHAGQDYPFVKDPVENNQLMNKLRDWGIARIPSVSVVAAAAGAPAAPPTIKGIAIPRGYNQGILEEQVLRAGRAITLDYSQPGHLPILAAQGIMPVAMHHRLTSPEIGLAGPYRNSSAVPQVPVFHPYEPTGNTPASARVDLGIARFSLTLRLSGGTLSNLPPGAAEHLVQYGVDLRKVETFVSFQNKPWQNDVLEFRPHAWLHQDAPEEGVYDRSSRLGVAFADIDSHFGPLTNVVAQTHNEGESPEVVFSPNNMRMVGLGDHTVTEAFYSFCLNKETGQVAITFHCLVNDTHQRALDQIALEGARGKMTVEAVHIAMVARGLPQAITDALGEFRYGRHPRAVIRDLPRHNLEEAMPPAPAGSRVVTGSQASSAALSPAAASAAAAAPASRPVIFSAASAPVGSPAAGQAARAPAPVAPSALGVPRPAAPAVPQAGVPAPAPSAASAPAPVAAPVVAPPPEVPAPAQAAVPIQPPAISAASRTTRRRGL